MASGKAAILVLAAAAVAGGALTTGTGSPQTTGELQRALAALSDGDLERAESIGVALIASQRPGCRRAWLVVAAARRRAGRYTDAAEAYRRYLAHCPRPEERVFVREQIRACQAKLTPPTPIRPLSERLSAEQTKQLADAEDAMHVETTEHFVVRAFNAELARLVGQQAERALERICSVILYGRAYPHSVEVYVWRDLAEYRRHATSAPEWSGGSFRYAADKSGQTSRRIDLTQRDARGRFDSAMVDRILPHEMCHLVLAELFGDARCPLAINEGLACLAESVVDNERIRLAGAALAGDRGIRLDELLIATGCDRDTAAVFYAEAFSLMEFLRSRLTARQFGQMLEHIRAGCPIDEAIQRALCVPSDERFLPRLARAWTAEAVRQTQILEALELSDAGG